MATGFVAPSEIQNWFAAADLFVCTSLWQEPLARVHYEAMAAGLPIITTARGGNAEVIEVGVNGLVVENPEDPSCFVEKISEVLSNKTWMKKMGEKGREKSLSQYKWDRVASEILDVWTNSKQIVVATDVPSKTEIVLEDFSINHLAEQSGNVIEDIPFILETKENTFEKDDEKSKSKKNDEKSKSKKNDEKSKSKKNDEKSKSKKNDEKSKSKKNDEKSKSKKNDEKSKSKKNDEKSKSKKNDEKSKSKKNDEKSKSKKNDEKSKSKKNDEKSKSKKNDEKSKSKKNDEKSKSKKNDEKSKSKKDDKKSK